ncbi:MAG: acyl-CoA/acyl-ACP dehydrogenase [Chloroflexi bacterium]|nr:acyl-CoA/acyl-ACP dehydrogenase [Chloroflexota bacterium]
MDLGFNEEQEMLRKSARDFLDKECPKKLVRDMEEHPTGHSPELWKKMADLGWLGLPFPEKYGGMGFGFLDFCVLLEEMGRALLPGPYFSTVALAGQAIMDAGTEEQKQFLLPKIAGGNLVMALAWTEPAGRYDPSGIRLKATPQGDGYLVNGTKLFVHDAHVADMLLVAARTSGTPRSAEGITLLGVDARAAGVKATPLVTIAADKQCEVTFRRAAAARANVLGGPSQEGKGWPVLERLWLKGAIAECARMVGGAQWVLETTVQYAKDRVQFGRPIGSFQAIQHYCANMATDVDGARYIMYEAAWALDKGQPATMEVARAKAWVSDAYRRTCATAHQVHGAIGFTKDHDLQLYTRRAKAAEVRFGDADHFREVVAQQLGL